MAGGMTPGRGGRSLGERAAASGVPVPERRRRRRPTPPPATAARAGTAGCATRRRPPASGRACWSSGGSAAARWQGRVAYTVTGPHGPALVESWLPAARLEPR